MKKNKTFQIVFRVNEEMYEFLKRNADKRWIDLSSYLRMIIGTEMMYEKAYKEKYGNEENYC